MIRRYKTCAAAIEQAHAYDVEACTGEERAYWRAVLASLRAYRTNEILDKTSPTDKPGRA
jgi:hypothetical protein